ncbi:DUF6158 family protein [Dactylosporangium siamense]|uniref:Uncharacterized protein n=1 Tax=Dactylosporangium siamense TaxID=685454 RepID=A0A919UHH9_9ACTN|nr:DUF6158 family protein [Dactylosporangium siamense]GIG51625.1 hypothetical protein Dsi01nite_096660 [Dactylosporangium siamense]
MGETEKLLDVLYTGRDRLTSGEIQRQAIVAEASAAVVGRLESLPEGEYTYDEAVDALAVTGRGDDGVGVPAGALSDEDLSRELGHLHETRDDTFRHGSPQALEHHDERTAELEDEFLRRFPERSVDPRRLRT